MSPTETDSVKGDDGRTLQERMLFHYMENNMDRHMNWSRIVYGSLYCIYQEETDKKKQEPPKNCQDEVSGLQVNTVIMA